MKRIFNLKTILLAGIFFLLAASLFLPEREGQVAFNSLGTRVEIRIFSRNPKIKLWAATKTIQDLSKKINRYDPKSEVSQINRAAGKAEITVSKDTLEVIEESLAWSKKTDQAFDITVVPLINLWKSAEKKGRLPNKEELYKALRLSNYNYVLVNKTLSCIKLEKPAMALDLGGSGKGFALKKARETLIKQGVKSALISCQSTIASLGSKPGQKPWKVGLRHPRNKDTLLGYIYLSNNQSLSTSGDYERYYLIQGKKYNHILNPKTGWPAEQCESVTIVCEDPFIADAASTSIFVMGPQKGLAFLEKESSLEGLIITKSGKILTSSGFKWEKEEIK